MIQVNSVYMYWYTHTCIHHTGPRRVPNMRHEEVIEHPPPIVPTKHIDTVIPRYNRVLAAFRTNKLLTRRQLLPEIGGHPTSEVETHVSLDTHLGDVIIISGEK